MNRSEKRLMRLTARWVLATVIIGLSALVYTVLVRTAPQLDTSDAAKKPLRLAVFRAVKVDVQRPWRGYGTVTATESSDIPARITATVAVVPDSVVAGALVEEGQLIVALDPSDFQRQVEITDRSIADLDAQLSQLEVQERRLTAQLELQDQDVVLAKDERDRIEQLLGRGAANPRDFDLAKRAVIAAQVDRLDTARRLEELTPQRLALEAKRIAELASLEQAKENLARCRITSPIDGILQSVDVEVGEHLTDGQRAARVVNLERVEIPLMLPASSRRDLAVGDPVQLRSGSSDQPVWNAQISRIVPEDDASTRTVTAFVDIDQPEAHRTIQQPKQASDPPILTPGLFVAGVVTTGEVQQRWVVPQRALQNDHLLMVDNGMVRIQPVKVAFVVETRFAKLNLPDEQWAVLEQADGVLNDGDLVVLNGSTSAQPGQAVTAVIATTDPATSPRGTMP